MSYVCNFFRNAYNNKQDAGRHLEISRERKMSSDWLILTKLRCKLQMGTLRPCYTKQFFLQVASGKKFTCNIPFCNCNCCVASCKKSRTTLYFSQRCETSCLRVTSPLQLATQFCQNGSISAHLSLAGDFKMAAVVNNEKKLRPCF